MLTTMVMLPANYRHSAGYGMGVGNHKVLIWKGLVGQQIVARPYLGYTFDHASHTLQSWLLQ